MIGHSRCKKSRPLYSPQSRYVRCTRSCLLWANSGHRPVPSLLGAGPPVCRLIDGERIHRQISDVNVKDHLVLAPDAANSMLLAQPCKSPPSIANERRSPRVLPSVVGTRQRSKCCRRSLNVGENLPGSLGHESQAERQASPKSGNLGSKIHQQSFRKSAKRRPECPLHAPPRVLSVRRAAQRNAEAPSRIRSRLANRRTTKLSESLDRTGSAATFDSGGTVDVSQTRY